MYGCASNTHPLGLAATSQDTQWPFFAHPSSPCLSSRPSLRPSGSLLLGANRPPELEARSHLWSQDSGVAGGSNSSSRRSSSRSHHDTSVTDDGRDTDQDKQEDRKGEQGAKSEIHISHRCIRSDLTEHRRCPFYLSYSLYSTTIPQLLPHRASPIAKVCLHV